MSTRQSTTVNSYGEVKKEIRRGLWESTSACFYCGRFPQFAGHRTVDHKIPRSRGGDNSIENLVACCRPCNSRKKSMTTEEYRERIRRERYTFTQHQYDWILIFGIRLPDYKDSPKVVFPGEQL